MPERYFLDANVLFTAAISPGGASSMLLELARVQACMAVTSSFALDEAFRNIRSKRPAGLSAMTAIATDIEVVPEADPTLVAWSAGRLPPKDAPILAAAIAAKAHVLVTGDRRHFGTHYGKSLKGVTILPPRDALERLLGP